MEEELLAKGMGGGREGMGGGREGTGGGREGMGGGREGRSIGDLCEQLFCGGTCSW